MSRLPELNECRPGILPVEYNVVILPEPVEEKTSGGIFRPETTKDTDKLAQTRGLLIAISPLAFSYDVWPEGSRKPQPGDVVWYGRYAGVLIEGADKREYRLCKDKDVGAIVIAA